MSPSKHACVSQMFTSLKNGFLTFCPELSVVAVLVLAANALSRFI